MSRRLLTLVPGRVRTEERDEAVRFLEHPPVFIEGLPDEPAEE